MIATGLYLHIPVCRRRCDYCDFFSCVGLSAARQQGLVSRILTHATQELTRSHAWAERLVTLYVGGGTPSALCPEAWDRLVGWIGAVTEGMEGEIEVTVELNPEDITMSLLESLERAGVNRLSVGVQSLDERVLQVIGRHTTLRETERGLDEVASAWKGRWSADLITCVAGRDDEAAAEEVKRVMRWNPDHLSIYELTVENGTRLAHRYRREDVTVKVSDGVCVRQLRSCEEEAARFGLTRYETSSFARHGCESRHNARYWRVEPWVAAGPGAVALVPEDGKATHHVSPRSLARYDSRHFGVTHETLSTVELIEEYLMGGLRTTSGVDGNAVADVGGVPLETLLQDTCHRWSNELTYDSQRCHLYTTERGRWMVNAILVDAFAEVERRAAHLFPRAHWPLPAYASGK